MTNFGTVVSGGEELGDGGEVARELLAHRLARVVVGRPQDRRRMRGRRDEVREVGLDRAPPHVADQGQSRLLAALAEDRLRCGGIEMAAAAALGRLAQRRQVARAGEEGRGVEPVLDSRHVLLAARGRGGRTGRTRGWTPASSVSLRRLEWT